jgi:hypothetical protein
VDEVRRGQAPGMSENERESDVSSRVNPSETADDQPHDLEDDADLKAQQEVFLAMVEEPDEDV